MSCPLSPGEIRELIRKLQELEEWSSQEHQGTQAAASGKGYRRGDPKARASAAGPTVSCSAFPGIAPLASLWVLAEEAGPPFIGSQAVRVEEGPGPVPALVEDQAVFVCWNQKEALQRIHLAYVAGFWARVSLDTFTDQVCPFSSCESPEHTIVLRACGLGGCVRFASFEHFEKLRGQTFAGGFLAHGFQTQVELEVFCQGAKIGVPACFKPC